MAKPSAKKKAKKADSETEESASAESAAGADQWAQVVMDGVPEEDGAEVTTDEPDNNTDQTAATPPEDLDDEIIDAEIIDLEDIDIDDPDDDHDLADEAEDGADPAEEADVAMAENEESDERNEQTEQAEPAEVFDPVDQAEAFDPAEAFDQDVTDAPPPVTEQEDEGEAGGDGPGSDISVEDLVLDLERVTSERDQYLDASRRLQAEFENYKKQVSKREAQARERANDSLIGELLPVLDAFDGAVANGAEDVAPMRTSFLDALAKQGLERIDPPEGAFDPNLHEAVMHEDADDTDGPVVAEVMRAGYVWKGRVLRPAMVRTRG